MKKIKIANNRHDKRMYLPIDSDTPNFKLTRLNLFYLVYIT